MQSFEYRLLKPKTREKTMMYEKYPIVAIMVFDSQEQLSDESLSAKDFDFQEWAYIKSVEQVKEADSKRALAKE